MANEDEKLPRSAVVIFTASGERIKPICPVCGHTYWGKLKPPDISEELVVGPAIPVQLTDKSVVGMGVQLWVCRNCGYLWFRTGATDPIQFPGKLE